MSYWIFIILVAASADVAFGRGPKIVPCYKADLHCVSQLEQLVAGGFPEYGIASIDPFTLSELRIDQCGLTLRNISVAGVTKQQITYFNLDPNDILREEFTVPIDIFAKVFLDSYDHSKNSYGDESEVYAGNYLAKANIFGKSVYPLAIQRDTHGIEHLVMGPDTNEGGIIGKAEAGLKLTEEILHDPSYERLWHCNNDKLHDLVISKMAGECFRFQLNSIRAITSLLPRRTFFYDL